MMNGKHKYNARLEGNSIIVEDKDGNKIDVSFAGTSDNRTVYAYVQGVGFIGGWQWPSPPLKFQSLVRFINQGIVYYNQSDLPALGGKNSRGPRRR